MRLSAEATGSEKSGDSENIYQGLYLFITVPPPQILHLISFLP